MEIRPEPSRNWEHQQNEYNQPVRGKLKIFLGYATGVGKTFAMLEAARHLQEEGIDVVVGYVETYSQSETDSLLDGMERLPYRSIVNPDSAVFFEMDTDAILRRQPQIALVDDLDHINVPGSRHTHRYQDVLELLNSGIDVFTTMNIQHLESLNDVVSQVTGVTEGETIPDHILDEADQIELVDLPVDELMARMKAGKILIPTESEEQFRKFFRPGNLTALREMALRRVVDRVDEQMRAYMQTHAISGPWPASERILVCVSPSPLSERLVRTTRRLARRLDADWIAAYVETAGHARLTEEDEERVIQTLRLAERLGAQTVRLAGNSVAETVVNYALNHNITKIVAGKPLRPHWREWLRGSIIDQILRHSQDLDVYVISGKAEPQLQKRDNAPALKKSNAFMPFLLSIGLVVLVTLLGLPLQSSINPTNLVMLYLAAVMVSAVWLGRWPAIVTSLLSVLAFDIMFVPPYHTLAVDDAEYLLTFVGFLAVGLVISTLTSRAQEQVLAARNREAQTAALYELSQRLANVSNLANIAQTTVNHVKATFNGPAAIFLPGDSNGSLIMQANTPDFEPEKNGTNVAKWVFKHGQPAGRYTDTMTNVNGYYIPLQTAEQIVGVMGLGFIADHEAPFSGEQRLLLNSFSNQVALAVERARLADQARRARLLEETEKLQTTLLNSISHDLRTPLATITGALSSLLDDAELLTAAAQQDLVRTAWEEALRLNRLVGNLLDMTRLESGAMKIVCQPYDIQELVGATLAQMPNRLRGRHIKHLIPDDLPTVAIDLTLMIQALVNLIDNALKYAPPDEVIEIEAFEEDQTVVIAVKDRGPGLPEGEWEHIFNKFFRLNPSGTGGIGLGLSIVKGIVEAHEGRVWAENRPGGGAVFFMSLPQATVSLLVED